MLCMCRWTFKAQHFDSVMLFKMGKFYEMFNMVCVSQLSSVLESLHSLQPPQQLQTAAASLFLSQGGPPAVMTEDILGCRTLMWAQMCWACRT